MTVIDVTVVGGPDIGVRRRTRPSHGGTRVDLEVYNADPTPARLDRVGVLVESPRPRRVVELGWSGWDTVRAGPPDQLDAGPDPAGVSRLAPDVDLAPGTGACSHVVLSTSTATIGWLASGSHPGVVVARPDGWLSTAWALLDGLILAPGEVRGLDPLWLGPGGAEGTIGHAAAWDAVAWGDTVPHDAAHVRPSPGAAVWVAGATPVAGAIAAAAAAGIDVAVVSPGDVVTVAAAGLRAGVALPLDRPWTLGIGPNEERWARCDHGAVDLTHPGTMAHMSATGAALAEAGATLIVLTGARAALAPASRWGDAAGPVGAWLGPALAAVRSSTGGSVRMVLGDGPLGAVAGSVDAVQCTPPVRQPADVAVAVKNATARSDWSGRPWHLASGPIDPAVMATADPAPRAVLAGLDTVVLSGDPRSWDAGVQAWLASVVERQRPTPGPDLRSQSSRWR